MDTLKPLPQFTLKEIEEWTDGVLHQGEFTKGGEGVSGFSIDTRTILKGELYVAIRGKRLDGHAYVHDAESKGAVACMVDTFDDTITIPQIVVTDTTKALGDCAKGYRSRLSIPCIAVTGSNGKTTTKNFIAAILSKKYHVAYTKGSFNNNIGLPLSVLSIRPDDQIAVIEIGTNHKGEIAELTALFKPTHAVLTNIGVAHIENFGSKEAIAEEKADVFRAVPSDGVVIVPSHDAFSAFFLSTTHARGISVDSESKSSRRFLDEIKMRVAIPKHIADDALLAREIGVVFGVSEEKCVDAICSAPMEEGRFTLTHISTPRGTMDIIDDTYNGNPDSVCAALSALHDLYVARRKIVAIGYLGELGDYAVEGYRRIVAKAREVGVYTLIFVDVPLSVIPDAEVGGGLTNELMGERAPMNCIHLKSHKECAEAILQLHHEGDIVLLKGSKSAAMKDIIGLLM